MADIGLAGRCDLVEDLDEALAGKFGDGIGDRPPDEVAVADKLVERVVGYRETVVPPSSRAMNPGACSNMFWSRSRSS